jgi:outer membrane protein insertion porin family
MIGQRIFQTIGFFLVNCLAASALHAQTITKAPADFANPKEYILGPIRVEGVQYLDPDALLSISGLREGDKLTLPSDALATASRKLWDQGLLADVAIMADKITNDSLFLVRVDDHSIVR